MQNLVTNFLVAHQQWAEGAAIGFLLANPGTCAVLLFNLLTRLPGVGLWIGSHPADQTYRPTP